MNPKSSRRRYSSTFISVSKARRDFASFAKQCGLDELDTSDLTLALGEACNNAVEHGHAAGGDFEVRSSYRDGTMTIEVSDRGAGFNPKGKGEWREPEARGLRGLGIFVMRCLTDDIRFLYNSGTSVRMIKACERKRRVPERGSAGNNGHLSDVGDRSKPFSKAERS